MLFKTIREAICKEWLDETKRERVNDTDNYNASFECNWQTNYGKSSTDEGHCSIFCSIGDWNTNLTDYLTDERFDHLDFDKEEDKHILFRQYTKILLASSEIMTDFQDLLSTFRLGRKLTDRELSDEKNQSRKELDKYSSIGDMQRLFTFINNICKHKINNIHICNHHLKIEFADLRLDMGAKKTIRLTNVNAFISNDSKTIQVPDTIGLPKLSLIINALINGYKIVDEAFRSDPDNFDKFRDIYKGKSAR